MCLREEKHINSILEDLYKEGKIDEKILKELKSIGGQLPRLHELAKVHTNNPVVVFLLKVNKRNTRTRCQICSKLTIKTPEQVNVVVLVSLLLTLIIFHTLF